MGWSVHWLLSPLVGRPNVWLVSQLVSRLAGCSDVWFVSWLVVQRMIGQSEAWLFCRKVGCLVGRSARWLVGWSVGQSLGWVTGSCSFGWLVGAVNGWVVGQSAGCLAGWLNMLADGCDCRLSGWLIVLLLFFGHKKDLVCGNGQKSCQCKGASHDSNDSKG